MCSYFSEQKPKSVGTYLGRTPVKHLLIVCDKANGTYPRIWPGAYTRSYMPFDDPASFEGTDAEKLVEFRRVRDLIGDAMKVWGAEAGGTTVMRRYVAEVLGTFSLVFCGTGAVVIDDVTHGGVTHVGIAMTFGLVVMALIYALGEVSGAHFNPAVTAGFWLARRFPGRRVPAYMACQLVGGVLASVLLRAMFGNRAHLGATLPAGPDFQSFLLEMVLTAFLMFVILNVSTGPKETGVMAGIAVGGVIGLEAMFAGPISGASMNPARSLAPAVVSGHFTALWVYLIAPFLGAAIAVPCWRATRDTGARPAP